MRPPGSCASLQPRAFHIPSKPDTAARKQPPLVNICRAALPAGGNGGLSVLPPGIFGWRQGQAWGNAAEIPAKYQAVVPRIPTRGTTNTKPWYNKYQAVVPPAASLERERSAPSRVSNTGRVCARKRPIPCENPLPKVKLTEKERPGRLTIGRYCYICSANQPI